VQCGRKKKKRRRRRRRTSIAGEMVDTELPKTLPQKIEHFFWTTTSIDKLYTVYVLAYGLVLASYAWTTHANKSNFYVAARQPQLLYTEMLLNWVICALTGE